MRALTRSALFGCLLTLCVAAAQGKTIFVNAAASGTNDGSSWANAFTSVQSALAAAVASDEIWVAAGTYKPTATTDRTISFALKNAVGVYGGFAGTETLRSQRNPAVNVTILSGDIGVAGNASDDSFHVVTSDSTVTATGVLDGFTITGGNANGAGANQDRGGGMWVNGGSATISHCIFNGNSASERGGGLRLTNVTLTIDGCLFTSNSAGTGGGGLGTRSGSTFTVQDTTFRGNSTGPNNGAGLEADSGATVINCVFQNNSGNGLLFNIGGTVINSTFTGNSSYGVAFIQDGTIVNSILWADSIVDEVFVGFGTISVTYSDVGGTGFGGTGNKNADPLFLNAGTGDLRLGSGSPAIDCGNNSAVPGSVTTDIAGLPRFFDDPIAPNTGLGTPPIVDMGANERVPISVTAPSPSPQTVCAGTSISFSVTASGNGPFTYKWRHNSVNLSDGGSISGSATAMLTINPTATGDTGSYDVIVTDSFGQPLTSVTGSLTVNAVPAAPTAGNNGPICAGGTLTLTATTVAGATYAWTGPNGFTSTSQNPSIANATTAATGTYTVRATVSGCQSAPATTTATVNAVPPAPTAGNNGPICAGGTLQLTASTVPGATYAWTGPNGFTSTSQNPSIANATAAATGTYSVRATVSGCQSAPATTTATVHGLPSAVISAPASVCGGSTANAASVPDAGLGATYSWGITNGTITAGAGTRSIAFTAGATGSVGLSVTVTDANACAANGSASIPTSGACLSFFTLTPCRVLDTRNPIGPARRTGSRRRHGADVSLHRSVRDPGDRQGSFHQRRRHAAHDRSGFPDALSGRHHPALGRDDQLQLRPDARQQRRHAPWGGRRHRRPLRPGLGHRPAHRRRQRLLPVAPDNIEIVGAVRRGCQPAAGARGTRIWTVVSARRQVTGVSRTQSPSTWTSTG